MYEVKLSELARCRCGSNKDPFFGTVRDGFSLNCHGCGCSFVEYHGSRTGPTADERLAMKWNQVNTIPQSREEKERIVEFTKVALQGLLANPQCKPLAMGFDVEQLANRAYSIGITLAKVMED